jgi:drug/metabolite transporter (DMT)-like permease
MGMKFLQWGHSKEEFHKGVFYMLLSSATLSLFTLFSKFGTENTSYFLLTFLRFGVPFVLLLPFLLWSSPVKELFHATHLKIQFLRSACVLVYQYSIFYFLMHATLLDATVLQNTAPLFIPILERIFFKRHFKFRVLLSIFISFAGVLCILQPDKQIFAQLSIAGLLAPLGQAGSQVLFGHQARHENQKANLFYLFFLCSLFSAVIFLFSEEFFGEKNSLENYSFFAWANVFALGIASIFNQSFRGMAYQHASASALAPFLYFSLIISGLFDWIFFNNLPNWLSLGGAILVILGGLIQIYKKGKPK